MGLGIYTRICRLAHLVKRVNLFATAYWNFRLFPYKIAKTLPILIGYNVDLINLKKGSISIRSNSIYRGMVKIGITDFPIFPAKKVHTMLRLQGGSKIVLGENITINKGCSIVASYGSTMEMGNDVWINMNSLIYCTNSVKIGNHVRVGWCSQIYDTSVHFMVERETGNVSTTQNEILISDNVWIANHATIAPGTKIPPFTTVASCSLVNKNFMHETAVGGLLAGMPAKFKDIGKIRIWNEQIEGQLKHIFISEHRTTVNVDEIGQSQFPFDANKNILYVSN